MGDHRILIVEDDEAIRDALSVALRVAGYKVAAAADGKEGLSLLVGMPRPCLILLDMMMPVMNGWEFVQALHADETLAAIPVVAVTAYGDRAKDIRAQAVILKPFNLDAVMKVVRDYC